MTRPLDNLHSIKLKIGVVIVAAVLTAACPVVGILGMNGILA